MKTRNIIGILLTICSVTLFAQNPVKGVVGAGPDKIYVNLGLELASKKTPYNDIVAFRIERKQISENSWKILTETGTTISLADFKNKLEAAMKVVPNPLPLNSIPVENIWRTVDTYRRLDSLKFWGIILPVRIALGITYIDNDAKQGVLYKYRISKINSAGAIASQMVTPQISFPGSVNFLPPKLIHQEIEENKIILKWNASFGKRPSSFLCYRQDQLKGSFSAISPVQTMSIEKDSIYLTLSDTLIQPANVYRYYILPMDYYGNTGFISDTAFVANYNFNSIPLPNKIRAASLDSLCGIRLSWNLSNPENIKSLKIFRSEQWGKKYNQIAEVSAETNSYIDQNVEPMVKYFYYIVMTGAFSEVSAPSARTFGIFQSAIKPVRPWILKYEGTRIGARLEFGSPEKDIAGYRVYRGLEGKNMSLITDLLPKRDSITIFIDSDSTLSGSVQYGYSVRTENVSHMMSDFSDTIYIRPLKSTNPPTPRDLTAEVDGKVVQLYWLDMQPFDETIDGYFIYRREITKKAEGRFKKLFDKPLTQNLNRYTDTISQDEKVLDYAVQSVNIFGGVSVMSNPIRVELAIQQPIPPAGVRARTIEEGVLIQWDKTIQKNIAGYYIYRYIRGKKPERIADLKQNELDYTDKKMKRGELYFYYITSVNDQKIESSPSCEVGIRP